MDRILLINGNRLVDGGTHQSLLNANDYYQSIVAYQQSISEEEPLFSNLDG